VLVACEEWSGVADALAICEASLGLSYDSDDDPVPATDGVSPIKKPTKGTRAKGAKEKDKGNEKEKKARKEEKKTAEEKREEEYVHFADPLERAMAIHILMLGVVWWVHVRAFTSSILLLYTEN
jgi:hypothetical protein